MTEITEILRSIMDVSLEYDLKLDGLKEDFKTQSLSNEVRMDFESQIKHQTYALTLLREYITNQIASTKNFIDKWTLEEKVRYLINYDSHGLTNGKFYDYAVGHEIWRLKRLDIYNLIENKIHEYSELERALKFAFRKYVALNYDTTIWYFPSKLLTVIKNELDNGNQIVESSSDEYFQHKIFLKFKYEFRKDYTSELTETTYRKLGDIKYWNEEYQDYFIVLTSGFERRKNLLPTWVCGKWGLTEVIEH
jgi:hypothetical protein